MTTPYPAAVRASAFSKVVGVNAFLQASQGNAYVDVAEVIADMAYLGSTQMRDNVYPLDDPNAQAAYKLVAQAGIKFDLCVGSSNSDLPAIMAGLDAFEKAEPGAVTAVEGPNEINYFPFYYGDLKDGPAAAAFQANLYASVHADPALSGVSVIDYTGKQDAPEVSADDANVHLYPALGDQPDWYFNFDYTTAYGGSVSGPKVITEGGYNTDPLSFSGVTAEVAAKQTLNLLFDAIKAQVSTVYLYELMDHYADPGDTNEDNHWGLFNADGTPKPAATAIHNTQAILADTSASATTFATGSLAYTLSGLPWDGQSLLLEKADGTYDLVIWAEPDIWDPTTATQVAAPSAAVTVTLGQVVSSASVYDPTVSASALSKLLNPGTITVQVTDHPVIIELSPGPAAPVITSGVNSTGASPNRVTLSGSAAAGSTVTVTVTSAEVSTPIGTTTASSYGTWSFTTGTLPDQVYDFTATATAASGLVSQSSSTFSVTAAASPPKVRSMISTDPAGTRLITGQTDYFVLRTTNSVSVTGTPSLAFANGSSATYDASHSDPMDMVFRFVAKVGETSSDLVVSGISMNGGSIADAVGQSLSTAGLASLAGGDTHIGENVSSMPIVQVGTGPNVLALDMSEDPWGAHAQFAVSIDGAQVGPTLTTTASSLNHQVQEFDIHTALSAGAHTLAITFLNDGYGGSASTDRNLDFDGASLNGTALVGASAHMNTNGTQTFTFTTHASGTTGMSIL